MMARWFPLVFASVACVDSGTFVCQRDDQCVRGGEVGVCQPATDLCSFVDGSCPSGQRYGAHAGHLSGRCVEGDPADAAIDAPRADAAPPDATPGPDGSQCGAFAQECCPEAPVCQGTMLCGGLGCTCYGDVSAGREHVVVAKTSGRVWGWGNEGYGQLGAYPSFPGEPVQALDPVGIIQVAAGYDHTCGLDSSGTLRCWGRDDEQQLGDGPASSTGDDAVIVGGVPMIARVGAGWYHNCAIDVDGAVWCWGWNEFGQAGQPPGAAPDFRSSPALVSGVTGAIAIAAGSEHTCVVTNAMPREVWCFGHNDAGQLGQDPGMVQVSALPMQVNVDGSIYFGAGAYHTCVIDFGGSVWCWGDNANGELGISDPTPRFVPVEVDIGPIGADSIAVGYAHVCAVTFGGELVCWGRNLYGELGMPADGAVVAPTPILSNVWFAIAGNGYTCAFLRDQSIRCFGGNSNGTLGFPPPPIMTHVPTEPLFTCP